MQDYIKPMLAHSYDKYSSKLTFPCYVQPKLDGMRCIYNYDKRRFYSRNGKEITSVNSLREQIREAIVTFRDTHSNILPFHLDGELYNHTKTFQQIISSTRKTVNIEKEDTDIEYHVFDIIPIFTTEKNMSYIQRVTTLSAFMTFAHKNFELSRLVFVPTYVAQNNEALSGFYNSFLLDKYEGVICRNSFSPYKHSRSFDLLKLKPVDTSEVRFYAIRAGQGKYKNTLGYLSCINSNGKELSVGSGFTDAQRDEIWNNKDKFYSKKFITIKHNGYTDDKIERFPIFVAFRDYE